VIIFIIWVLRIFSSDFCFGHGVSIAPWTMWGSGPPCTLRSAGQIADCEFLRCSALIRVQIKVVRREK